MAEAIRGGKPSCTRCAHNAGSSSCTTSHKATSCESNSDAAIILRNCCEKIAEAQFVRLRNCWMRSDKMRRTGCSEFGGDAASDEIRRKGFRHDARKSFAEKKAGGIFFGERECERAVVGRNKQQVASCALRRDKGRQRMMWATWLAEEGFTVLRRYFGSRYLKAWKSVISGARNGC